jgi:hypothetical protein
VGRHRQLLGDRRQGGVLGADGHQGAWCRGRENAARMDRRQGVRLCQAVAHPGAQGHVGWRVLRVARRQFRRRRDEHHRRGELPFQPAQRLGDDSRGTDRRGACTTLQPRGDGARHLYVHSRPEHQACRVWLGRARLPLQRMAFGAGLGRGGSRGIHHFVRSDPADQGIHVPDRRGIRQDPAARPCVGERVSSGLVHHRRHASCSRRGGSGR